VTGVASGADEALGWFDDTRDDGTRIQGMPMPDPDWFTLGPNEPDMVPSGFLSRVEVGYLQGQVGKRGDARSWKSFDIPKELLIQVKDTLGRNVETGSVQIYRPGNPKAVASAKLNRGGIVLVKVPGDAISFESQTLEVSLDRGGDEDRAVISV